MNMYTAVRQVVGKTFVWEGRATRDEFWWFALFSVIAYLPVVALSVGLGTVVPFLIWVLVLIAPSLGVTARRLHDTHRSATWLLLCLVPYAGIAVLILCGLPGTPGVNRYGWPDPVAAARAHRTLGFQYYKIGAFHIAAGHVAQAVEYAMQAGQNVERDLAALATLRHELGEQRFLMRMDEAVEDAGVILRMLGGSRPGASAVSGRN